MGQVDIKVSDVKHTNSFNIALKKNERIWDANQVEGAELLDESLEDVSLKDLLDTIVELEKGRKAKAALGSSSIQSRIKSTGIC
jgi:hypothetical protein